MHAMKQARWLKRRQPELEVSVFYTDLRAPGSGQEAYIRAGIAEGVRIVRSRPGLIAASSSKNSVAVRYDDPETGSGIGELFDIVVINGGLEQCPLPSSQNPSHASCPSPITCGFCAEPTDIAGSAVQGASAAAAVLLRRGSLHKGGAA